MRKILLFHFRLAVLVLCAILLFAAIGQGATQKDIEDEIPAGLKFFPRIGIGLEYGGYVVH